MQATRFPDQIPARALVFIVGVLCLASVAPAWMRTMYRDDELAQRSELIVVASIKEGSIREVQSKPRSPDSIGPWHYEVVLIVREVLKGDARPGELPIVINYGLDPLIDGKMPRSLPAGAVGPIRMVDSGGDEPMPAALGDLRHDAIWMLCKRSGEYGRDVDPNGRLGITDPQELQPLEAKDYLLSYLAPEPEKSVRDFVTRHPEFAARAMPSLDRYATQAIIALPDPAERVQKLLPYLFRNGSYEDVWNAVIATGDVGGAILRGEYERTNDRHRRSTIIRAWGRMKWRGCTELLIAELERQDAFWAHQKLEPGWWNRDVGSPRTETLRGEYGIVYSAVWTLGQIGDPEARPAIEKTLARWKSFNFEPRQIIEACEASLRK